MIQALAIILVISPERRAFLDLTTTPSQVGAVDRPFVVIHTDTVKRQLNNGALKHLTNLPDNATDVEWAKFLADHDGDVETALENFRAFLNGENQDEPEVKVETVPEPEPKKGTRRSSAKPTTEG